MKKKLYRSKTNRNCAGIIGGIGEYFEIDPTILRIIFVLATLFTFGLGGILAYVVLIFVIPENPEEAEYISPQDKK